ncbi:tail fiber assembly protein [Bordetella bronchiseptica]|uniref:tail fiber assembly protein n=1 Tax=Bordetella bronchiseptica TaxID=518 RepID=UPI00045B38FB|nr:tail assembly chaperone [Bordetella bronchiseptica]KAK53984.1 caudovirales tail fiber assembly protein [Bordetella bronchiseptica OSU054]
MFYSNQEGGFYSPAIHGNNMPDDAVEITPEAYDRALAWQSNGGVIAGVNADGSMVLESAKPPTTEQLEANALAQRDALLREAATRIAPLQDAVDLEVSTPEERDSLTAWKQYRVALNRIEQQEAYPVGILWPPSP